MKIRTCLSLLVLVTALALPTFIHAAQGEKTPVQKPKPFVEETFAGDEHDLTLSVKAVQEWTHQFLEVEEGDMDNETGAHMVEELQDYFTEDMALKIYNQFHRPHLAEYNDVDDYVEVDSLVHRDVEHVEIVHRDGQKIVNMKTSSVEDGAGNRAHFKESLTFSFDKEHKTYVLAEMEAEQVS
ncbi:hypothetical protein HUG20_16275 [Salicibibacter cibi]|uniref:Uncharacterized protein n=1 Tax=Salicibibacter cibi TaxID=2743001 RepID=A0A7T6ZE02_9BACI|nr:hypothetical protein [Salicibibacter cibi]QQK81311.1 hypothetical protein HUG20_16275 [Salicibibacter cibi]